MDFVVNILTDTQARLAAKYAVPGTPPLQHPPAVEEQRVEGEEGEVHPLEDAGLVEVKESAVPVVKDSIGAFACQVVDTVDLSRYSTAAERGRESKSVLYIARVLHIYIDTSGAGKEKRPLIYHRQKFVSTTPDSLSPHTTQAVE